MNRSGIMLKRLFGILTVAFLLTGPLLACPSYTLESTDNGNGNFTYTLGLDFTNYACSELSSITWNFGDGTVLSGSPNQTTVTHQYTSNATYNVSVQFESNCTVNDPDTGLGVLHVCGPVSTGVTTSVTGYVPVPPCPVAVFKTITHECPTGEVRFVLEVADTSSYWTLQEVEWNFGDGNTAVSNSLLIEHTYTTLQDANVTAVVTFVGANGEICSVQVVDITAGNSALNYLNDPTLYESDYLSYSPFVAVPGLYATSPTGVYCEDQPISIFNLGEFWENGQSVMTPSSPTGWSYELFLDGQSVASGSGIPDNSVAVYTASLSPGDYIFEIVYSNYHLPERVTCTVSASILVTVVECSEPCENCNSFQPYAGDRYWVSAWVQEDLTDQVLNYDHAYLTLEFVGSGTSTDFIPSGDIIEGWQRIVGSFTIPANTTELKIHLKNSSGLNEAFFDDIRVHPFNASMKSYVYDPETFWLTAELDDNNYATFYEYDQEGQLIRIKKETSRGIMTIQESRSSNPKDD